MSTFEVRLAWDGAVVPGLRAVGALQSSVGVITLYDGMLDHVVKVPGGRTRARSRLSAR